MTTQQTLVISTQAFLDNLEARSTQFKAQGGIGGKWLSEYEQMDQRGWFESAKLKDLYTQLQTLGSGLFIAKYGYIRFEAINYIGILAYDDTTAYLSTSEFSILNNDGSVSLDEIDEPLEELEFAEAVDICRAINDEALDYIVYVADSITNKFIYRE